MLAFSSYIQISFSHIISKKSTGWFTIDVLVKLLDHVCILEDNQKYMYMEVGGVEDESLCQVSMNRVSVTKRWRFVVGESAECSSSGLVQH